jgi:hypothetical protein
MVQSIHIQCMVKYFINFVIIWIILQVLVNILLNSIFLFCNTLWQHLFSHKYNFFHLILIVNFLFFVKQCNFLWQLGENMVFYTKKVEKQISSFKKDSFSQKHKKINSIFT